MRVWGMSSIEKPTVRYTRRWERWLAVVWPPRRRQLRLAQLLADMSLSEIQAQHNRVMRDLILYGHRKS